MRKTKYEQGYKKYETKAKKYLDNPKKTESLLNHALFKANKKKNSLSEVWDKLQLLISLVRSWTKGEYRKIPVRSIIMVIATIIYFVSPLDFVPDFLLGFGFLDDAAVIGFTLKQISKDLDKYQAWRQDQNDHQLLKN